MCVYIYIYIYIHIQRERERDTYMCIHIYIHIVQEVVVLADLPGVRGALVCRLLSPAAPPLGRGVGALRRRPGRRAARPVYTNMIRDTGVSVPPKDLQELNLVLYLFASSRLVERRAADHTAAAARGTPSHCGDRAGSAARCKDLTSIFAIIC